LNPDLSQKGDSSNQTANPKTRPREDKQPKIKLPWSQCKVTAIELAAYLAAAVAGVAGIALTVLFSTGHRDAGIWTAGLAVVLTVIGATAYIQNYEWKKDAAAEAMTPDALMPGNGPDPEIKGKIQPSGLATTFVLLGNALGWTNVLPRTVLAQGDEPMIVIDKQNSNAWVSAKFFDQTGTIICEIVRNHFHLNEGNPRGNVFRKEITPHKLIVFDYEAKPVLEVEFVNPRTFRLLGDFYLRRGVHVVITPEKLILGGITMSHGIAHNDDPKGSLFQID
jgi:hypothetical protein